MSLDTVRAESSSGMTTTSIPVDMISSGDMDTSTPTDEPEKVEQAIFREAWRLHPCVWGNLIACPSPRLTALIAEGEESPNVFMAAGKDIQPLIYAAGKDIQPLIYHLVGILTDLNIEHLALCRAGSETSRGIVTEEPPCPEWAEEAKQILDELSLLPPDWDDQGAEPPNAIAIRHAQRVLSESIKMGFRPLSIAPCVEEGITFSFLIGKNLAAIECYNTGEIVAVTSGNEIPPEVWEVNEEGIREALQKLRVFATR